MPFPSSGCQTCRNRRIKCDEALPICQRCKKSGRVCSGARKPFSEINFENPYASGRKKRPRGPRSSIKVDPDTRSTLTVGPTIELAIKKEPVINLEILLPGLPFDLQTEALTYYIRRHVQTRVGTPAILKSLSDDLLHVWTPDANCKILDLAVSSIALSVFSRTQRYPPAAIEASRQYHKLILLLQSTITSLNKDNIEACLLAVMYSSLYEDSRYQADADDGVQFPLVRYLKNQHQDGVLALLKFWTENMRERSENDGREGCKGSTVVKHARRAMIKWCLVRSRELPDWLRDGAKFGEEGLEEEYDAIIVKTVSVRERLSALLESSQSQAMRDLYIAASKLDQEAQAIDKTLQDWTSQFPRSWNPHELTLSSAYFWPKEDFFSRTIYTYPSVAHAVVWMRYCASRMLINSTRLRLLKLLDANPQHTEECRFIINTMGYSLAASLPFCLGRFDIVDNHGTLEEKRILHVREEFEPFRAHLAMYPLTIASAIGAVQEELRPWLRALMVRVGRVMGFGLFEAAAGDGWLGL